MATAYTEFDSLGTNLLAGLQTAILASSDWTRPNSVTYPTLYKATTTRGAQMALDLNTTAMTVSAMNLTFYRTHDGTTAVDPLVRYLRMKGGTAGTLATNMYHAVVSAGKEHLFISVEGPRVGEANPDVASVGSFRMYIFMNDLVPYHAGDTTPAVVAFGIGANIPGSTVQGNALVNASRNAINTVAWPVGHLATLDFPSGNSGVHLNMQQTASLDSSKYYLSPYVYFDNTEGIRGRLASFYLAGYNFASVPDVPVPLVNQIVTYAGNSYKLLQVQRNEGSNIHYGGFGAVSNSSALVCDYSPIVAVPYA